MKLLNMRALVRLKFIEEAVANELTGNADKAGLTSSTSKKGVMLVLHGSQT